MPLRGAKAVCCARTFQRAFGAEHGAPGVERLDAVAGGVAPDAGPGLVRAVLAPVDHVERRHLAPGEAAVEPQIGTLRLERAGERHVLPVGPVRGGAPRAHLLDPADRVRVDVQVGVVVLELVVVPRDEPRVRGVRLLEALVGLVLAVPNPVLVQRPHLQLRQVRSDRGVAALVDVVAEEDHGLDVLRVGEVVVRREIALREVLARHERERDAAHHRVAGRARAGAAHRADPVAELEAVEVVAVGGKPVDLGAEAVRLVGQRDGAALADDRVEVLVL